MNVHVHALSSMAAIIYVFIEFNFLFYRVATSGKAFQHKAYNPTSLILQSDASAHQWLYMRH